MKNETSISKTLPVLFGFLVVGFVDLVGIATNYIKKDFFLSDSMANLLPMMVFLWFAIFSVPTGLLMNSIGRKKTVLLSVMITLLATIIPLISYNFVGMLVAFSLIGIGNTILQVSINPLLSNVVSAEKLTSSLTLGQFIKAVAAFFGPVISIFAASNLGSWKYIFPIYSGVAIISSVWLYFTMIEEYPSIEKNSSFADCYGLLKNKTILLLFLGIIFVVGIDVGLNTTVPKFLMERFNIPLEQAGLGSSLYFIARLSGTLIGAILLIRVSGRKFLIMSMTTAIVAMSSLLLIYNLWAVLFMIFIVGFAIANVFSIIFSIAIQKMPDHSNEVSGLMIMGIAGGAVILPVIGVVSDSIGQVGGMAVLLATMFYLFFSAFSIQKVSDI